MILLALWACNGDPITPDDDLWHAPSCPTDLTYFSAGDVESAEITEASGLVFSRRDPEVLWTHNDSGDTARLFAMGIDGTDHGTWTLPSATARDWEDIAWARDDDGTPLLIAADTGDNDRVRQDVTLWVAEEPVVNEGGGTLSSEGWTYEYPDGAHDAESVLYDPLEHAIFILTKDANGPEYLFRGELGGGMLVLETELEFGTGVLEGSPTPTGMDISEDGLRLMVVTYSHAFFWHRNPELPISSAMHRDPCQVWREPEVQGEAIAVDPNGMGYATVSEGDHQPIWRFEFLP